jgi:hypothetical protein
MLRISWAAVRIRAKSIWDNSGVKYGKAVSNEGMGNLP